MMSYKQLAIWKNNIIITQESSVIRGIQYIPFHFLEKCVIYIYNYIDRVAIDFVRVLDCSLQFPRNNFTRCIIIINSPRTSAARVTAVVPCVCVSVPSFLPPRASTPRNIGTYGFAATRKTFL